MRKLIHAENVAYGLALLLSGGAFFVARQFPRAEGAHSGPESFPVFLAVALAGMALVGLIRAGRRCEPVEAAQPEHGDRKRFFLLGALSVIYLLIMPLLGFITSTALLCMGLLLALGYRNPVRALAAGFVAAFILYALFGVLMNVALPKGWIG